MTTEILLVRHGQATFDGPDYDVLSPVGARQGRLLGEHLARWGRSIDRVVCGPRRRHRETERACAEGFLGTNGESWPEPVVLDELDEVPAFELVERGLPHLLDEADAGLREAGERFLAGDEVDPERVKAVFTRILRAWVAGEIRVPELVTWPRFRRRIAETLESLRDGADGGETVVAFTSGGPVAAAVGNFHDLDDPHAWELVWRVRNAAVSEIRWGPDRPLLHTFNEIPHLADPELVTYL